MIDFGIDIGGTTIKIGAFSKNVLLEKWEIKTNIIDNGRQILKDIADTIRDYCEKKEIKNDDINGFGFGIPGNVIGNHINFCPNIMIKDLDLKTEFGKYFLNKKIVSENDATLAAFGEDDGTYKNYVLSTIGTGVGFGIIIDGKPLSGTHGAAGEVGHMHVDDVYNFKCTCGLSGCLETVSSATAIKNLYNRFLADVNSLTSINGDITAKSILNEAAKGDAIALKTLNESAKYLARAFANVAVTVDPEIFFIGGGISLGGPLFLERVRHYYLNYAHYAVKDIPIEYAKNKNDAGIIGAVKFIYI